MEGVSTIITTFVSENSAKSIPRGMNDGVDFAQSHRHY